jgi:Tol biopolymer transport system component
MRPVTNLLLGSVAFIACFPLTAYAGDASFRHGVIGVELSERVGGSAAWSPDGKWIAVPARVGIRLRNVETGKFRELRAPAYRGFLVWQSRLNWSSDGKTIRYTTSLPRSTNEYASWLTEVPLDGSEVRQQSLGVKVFETDWAPSGWPFAFTTGTYAYDFDKGPIGPKPALLVVDRFGEEPHPVAQIVHDIGEAEIQEVQFSPDGERIVFCRYQGRHAAIWSVRPDGTDARRLWGGLTYCQDLNWSPGGRQLALVAVRAGSLVPRPYLLPVGGRRPHRLGEQYFLDGPVWSPDGRWLTFSNGEGEIRRVHPDGRGEQVIASFAEREIQNLLWSPDGRHLAYTADEFASD